MATLSKEEAKEIVNTLYPELSHILKPEVAGGPYPKVGLPAYAFKDAFPSVKREGITPDVFCKIAEAMSEKGISTDVDATFFSYLTKFVFRPAEKNYRKPSIETCRKRLDRAKKIEVQYNKKLSI